jgi:hypothetical protein
MGRLGKQVFFGVKPPWTNKDHTEGAIQFSINHDLFSVPAFDKDRYRDGVDLIANIQPDLSLATVRGMHSFRRYWGDVSRFPGMEFTTRWARVRDDPDSLNRQSIPAPIIYCDAVTAELDVEEPPKKDDWDPRTQEEVISAWRPRNDLIDFFENHLGFSVQWFPNESWIDPAKKGVLLIRTRTITSLQDKIEINRRQAWRNPAKHITYFL